MPVYFNLIPICFMACSALVALQAPGGPNAVATQDAVKSVPAAVKSVPDAVKGVPAAVKSVPDAAPYVLAGDDVIAITVLNFPRLSVPQTVISPDGVIGVPLLSPINVLGKTTTEVAELLKNQWMRYVKSPAVSVTLVQRRQDSLLMYGAVLHPGAVQYKPSVHVLALLAMSGGALPNADLNAVVVTHKDGARQVLDLSHPEIKGGSDQDIQMLPDDVVYIPIHSEVNVTGEVLKPGSYDYHEKMTVLEALTLAGGINPDTTDYTGSTLIHNGVEVKLDLEGMMRRGVMTGNVLLAPGDSIHVTLAENRTYVFGDVQHPGFYLYKPHDRITDALQGCGGTMPDADLLRITVIHINKDKTRAVAQKINMLKFFKDGKIEANPAISPGDVIFVPVHNKAFGLSDFWNVLAPLQLLDVGARIMTGAY